MRKFYFAALVLGLAAGATHAQHHGDHDKHQDHGTTGTVEIARDVTIEGHVIDIVCYTRHASIGEKHLRCARTCAKAGIPMGILEDGTNEIFLVFPPGHRNPNDQLMAYLEKGVTVEGTVHRKGGLKGITISSIKKRKG